MRWSTAEWESWAWTAGGVLLSVALALLGHSLLYRLLWRIARRSATTVDDALVRHTCAPTRLLLPLLALSASLDTLRTSSPELALLRQLTIIAVIAAVAWTATGSTSPTTWPPGGSARRSSCCSASRCPWWG